MNKIFPDKEQTMPKAILSLVLVLASFCLCQPSFALPQQHEAWYKHSEAYRTMYERYDTELQRASDALQENEYKAMDKENEAAIAKSIKQAESSGEEPAMACAKAMAERVVAMEVLISEADNARTAGKPKPLEGIYRLTGRNGFDGYLSISRDGNGGFCLETAVWQKDKPQTFGWSQAQAAAISNDFSTTSVLEPKTCDQHSAKNVQMHVAIKNGQAVVTTTEAFRKGGYVWFSKNQEETEIKNILLDGSYSRMK